MDRHDRNTDMGTRRPESAQPPQAERKHPPEWERDLNPDRMAGQNIGIPSDLPTAYDFKELHDTLTDFANDELRQIPVVPPGGRLKQGATYLDLCSSGRDEFTATGEMAAAPGDRLVPKGDVPYTIWNRLRGIDDPERTT
jgi:hypothetical protein